MVQPSSKREGFSAIPNVKWENVGGLDLLRKEFERYIVRRIKYPENYEVRYFLFYFYLFLFMCVFIVDSCFFISFIKEKIGPQNG